MESQQQATVLQRNAQNVLLGKRTNVLLVKDDVGKAKPSTRSLPKDGFTFGKSNNLTINESAAQGKYRLRRPLARLSRS